jgi:hypothetical protein
MTTIFSDFLDTCSYALGDILGAVWSRVDAIWPWALEGMMAFPILRPMLDDHTNGASLVYSYALPTDFREVIAVEYPISQTPPVYLVRKNRLDPGFYDEAGYYDIDHDYSTGSGWYCYVSGGVAASAHIKMQYLANHDTSMADDHTDTISIPDEYVHIIVAYVVAKAYRERLSNMMVDPTAHTSVVLQMTDMVQHAEEHYDQLVAAAQQRLAQSRNTPAIQVDKYDRVY